MTTNHMYLTWHAELKRMFKTSAHTLSKPQLRNLTRLLTGIFLSRSVHLSRIANKLAGRTRLVSATRRLS